MIACACFVSYHLALLFKFSNEAGRLYISPIVLKGIPIDHMLLVLCSAWFKSHIISSMSSSPIDRRIKSGDTPPAN